MIIRRAAVAACTVLLLSVLPALGAAPAEKAKPPVDDDYEMQRLLVDTIDQVQRNYVRPISRRKIVEAAIKGILNELDPYSSYIAPDEMDRFRSAVESEFGGVGIQVSVGEGHLRVISPLAGTPAYRAGIAAGDRIIEIDGKGTAGITIEEAMRKLKGKEGTQVTLTVIHPGRANREKITITRQVIHVDTVLGDHHKADDSWDYWLDSDKRIAYIRLTGFSRDTAADLRKVLAELTRSKKLGGLVLDLRFNPGGLLTSAVEVADLFVSEGRIVSTSGRNSPERIWNAHTEGTFEGFPMAVLVNHYSASASEIVSACLQDHKRAIVIGQRTWGKGSVQNVIPLDEKPDAGGPPAARSALKITTAGYKRPSGKNIDRAPGAKDTDDWGVRPDPGYELNLDEMEMLTLHAERRLRDVIQPKHAPEAAKPEAKPQAAKPESKPRPEAKPDAKFVDRQLQMAVNYLSGELARAK